MRYNKQKRVLRQLIQGEKHNPNAYKKLLGDVSKPIKKYQRTTYDIIHETKERFGAKSTSLNDRTYASFVCEINSFTVESKCTIEKKLLEFGK